MRFVFLALFAAASVVHLISSWRDEPNYRKITKPMLLIFLALYYVFSADKINVVLVCALAASWLGDVLLMPKGNAWFVAGGISFLASHILFIAVYYPRVVFSAVNIPLTVAVGAVYLAIGLAVILAVRKTTPKPMLAPLYLYLIANGTMNIFALMMLQSVPGLASALAYCGAVSFFASDCTLFLVRYHKNKDLIFKKHFTVMLTYILGEFLITQGILMLG